MSEYGDVEGMSEADSQAESILDRPSSSQRTQRSEEEVTSGLGAQRESTISTSESSKKTRSPVWDHFELLEVDGRKKGKCNYCR